MKKFIIFFSLILTSNLLAYYPPENINIKRDNKAIFVDFSSAIYKITYDLSKKKVYTHSIIKFKALTKGYPIFDLIPAIKKITLDGNKVTSMKLKIGKGVTTVRRITSLVSAGDHTLEIFSEIKKIQSLTLRLKESLQLFG